MVLSATCYMLPWKGYSPGSSCCSLPLELPSHYPRWVRTKQHLVVPWAMRRTRARPRRLQATKLLLHLLHATAAPPELIHLSMHAASARKNFEVLSTYTYIANCMARTSTASLEGCSCQVSHTMCTNVFVPQLWTCHASSSVTSVCIYFRRPYILFDILDYVPPWS